MKKLIVVTVAAIALIANMQAQNKKWSLKECIDYAILHNIEVKQSQNRIKSLEQFSAQSECRSFTTFFFWQGFESG